MTDIDWDVLRAAATATAKTRDDADTDARARKLLLRAQDALEARARAEVKAMGLAMAEAHRVAELASTRLRESVAASADGRRRTIVGSPLATVDEAKKLGIPVMKFEKGA